MRRGGCKDRIFSQIVRAGATVIAAAISQFLITRAYQKSKADYVLSARYTRLYRNSIPNFHILHLATRLYHDCGVLVSQDNRAGKDEVIDATSLPIMNIASTNTTLPNMYSNVVLVTYVWDVAVFDRTVS